jgi:hypothetical protein
MNPFQSKEFEQSSTAAERAGAAVYRWNVALQRPQAILKFGRHFHTARATGNFGSVRTGSSLPPMPSVVPRQWPDRPTHYPIG